MNNLPKNMAIGKAGELRVASELLLRGHEVFVSMVDAGVDLMLGSGHRIEVKTGHRRIHTTSPKNWWGYDFSFKKRATKKTPSVFYTHPLENISFVICWAIEDDEFVVMPASAIRGKSTLTLSLNNKGRLWSQYRKYVGAWDLLKADCALEVIKEGGNA